MVFRALGPTALYAAPRAIERHFPLILAVLVMLLVGMQSPRTALADNPLPVQTYYVPMPEQQIRESMLSLYSGTGSELRTVVALVVLSEGTIVYYDHWEDGYEANIHTPTQPSTQIWGDGNAATGAPPGYPDDVLSAGDIIVLENNVWADPRNPSDLIDPFDPTSYPFDGGDKIAVTQAVAFTRAAWPTSPGAVLAGAVEVYAANDWGTHYIMPVGEDTPSDDMFEYATFVVMAASPGTVVDIDYTLDGSSDISIVLNEGQSYLLPAHHHMLAGTQISASHPVQVYLITGDIDTLLETRWYHIAPQDQWGHSYYSPVSTRIESRDDRTDVFLYNPRPYAIQITFDTLDDTTTFSIPARSVARRTIPEGSGAHFQSQNQEPFFAIAAVDANTPIWDNDNKEFDWGFSLVPEHRLGSRALVSWAPGADFASTAYQGPHQNGSPVWITPVEATTVYVNLDADPNTGPHVDARGDRYDLAFPLDRLERLRVFNTPIGDQTGMLVYTLDGVRLAVAWGQDPDHAATGNPYLDLGTTVPPLPDFVAGKTATLMVDADDDGVPSPGDTLLYTVVIRNSSRSELEDASILDEIPAHTTYVLGSTGFDDGNSLQTVPDDVSGTPFPLDGSGLPLGTMPSESIFTVSFQVVVDPFPPAGTDRVINVAYVTASGRTISARAETTLHYLPAIALNKSVSDEGDDIVIYQGDSVTYRFVITNIGRTHLNGISLSDPALDLTLTSPGILAPGQSITFTHDAELFSDLHNTATVRATPCDATGVARPDLDEVTASDSAMVQVVAPNISLQKRAIPATGDWTAWQGAPVILEGTTVRYELVVGNPGNVPLADVLLQDDLCSPLILEGGDSSGNGLLDPGETWLYACSRAVMVDGDQIVINTATVSAQPSDATGAALPDISRVSAQDSASVAIVAPGITMTKRVSSPITYVGDTVTYRCTVTNTGDVPLADVTLQDAACPGMAYISGDLDGDDLLDPDESWVYTCQLTVMVDTINTAQVSAQPAASGPTPAAGTPLPGIDRVSAEDSASVNVVDPAIRLVKEASPTVIVVGDTVTYTLRVSNPGDVPLDDVTLVDDQCAALERLSGDDLLDPGEVWVYACQGQPQADITNIAEVSGQPTDDAGVPLPGIDRVSDQDSTHVRVVDPGLLVTKHAEPAVILPGTEVVYTMMVTNTGQSPLTDLSVMDNQCTGLAYVQGDLNTNGLLDSGENWVYRCSAQPTTSLTNTVEASGQPCDDAGVALPGISRVEDSDSAFVEVIRPDIELTKVAYPTVILAGETVVYTCTVRNSGDVPLSDVNLEDSQCTPMTAIRSPVAGDGDDLLNSGETRTYRCEAPLYEDSVNTAIASGQPSDVTGNPYPGIARVSAEDSAMVAVIAPAIDVSKTATPTVLYAGDMVTYLIEIYNTGDVPLLDVDLVDDRCSELVYIDGEGRERAGQRPASHGRSSGLLLPGASWRYRCLAQPLADTVNTVSVSAQPGDAQGQAIERIARVSAEDSAAVRVVDPGIALAKSASRPVVTVGEVVTYTFTVTNTGDVPMVSVSLIDDRCADLVRIDDEPAASVLDVGEVWRYRCQATLTQDTLNIAQASAQPCDNEEGQDVCQPLPGIRPEVDEASAFVRAIDPQVTLIKLAQPLRLYAGEMVTYTYRLRNTGDVPLRDVTLVDDKCAAVELLEGDVDGVLYPDQEWLYRCVQQVHFDTINTAVASGQPCEAGGGPGACDAFVGIGPVSATATAAVDVIEPECVEVFPPESFEQELSTRWYTSSGVRRTTDRAQSGQYSLRMGDGLLDRERAEVAFILPDELTLFSLSFFWSVETTEYQYGQDQLIVYLQNASGDIIAEVARLDARDRRMTWHLAARDLLPWADQAYGLVFECVTNSSRPSVFYVDNISLRLCSFDLPYGCALLDYYFHDEFNDSALGAWQYDLGGGTHSVTDSVISLRPENDNVDRFPVFWTNEAFPLRESFLFEARFRFSNITPYGTTVGIGSKYYYGARYYEGNEPPPQIENILSIHHLDSGYWVSLMGEKLWLGDVDEETWRTVQLIRREYTWILRVDGEEVGSVRSTINPRSLFIGNPAIQRWDGDWTYLDVDYLRVTACMGQGIVRVWQPLVLNQSP
jgi:uncharacterized repeat protein (TIGR01451 family)